MRNKYLSLLFATLLICSSISTVGAYEAEKVKFELTEKFELKEPVIKLNMTYDEWKQIKLNKENEIKRQKEDERLRVEAEQKRIIEDSKQEFELTFYTEDDNQNGFGNITCTGAKLSEGMVASNYYPLGTIIYLEGYGEVIVSDTGSSNFSNSSRLDVFIARKNGEDIHITNQRALRLGKQSVAGYIK